MGEHSTAGTWILIAFTTLCSVVFLLWGFAILGIGLLGGHGGNAPKEWYVRLFVVAFASLIFSLAWVMKRAAERLHQRLRK